MNDVSVHTQDSAKVRLGTEATEKHEDWKGSTRDS